MMVMRSECQQHSRLVPFFIEAIARTNTTHTFAARSIPTLWDDTPGQALAQQFHPRATVKRILAHTKPSNVVQKPFDPPHKIFFLVVRDEEGVTAWSTVEADVVKPENRMWNC